MKEYHSCRLEFARNDNKRTVRLGILQFIFFLRKAFFCKKEASVRKAEIRWREMFKLLKQDKNRGYYYVKELIVGSAQSAVNIEYKIYIVSEQADTINVQLKVPKVRHSRSASWLDFRDARRNMYARYEKSDRSADLDRKAVGCRSRFFHG